MTWSSDWWRVPMAPIPDVAPIYPLPNVKPRFWDRSFGYRRPSKKSVPHTRYHMGNDLVDAADNEIVVAAEAGEVIKVDAGWSKNSKAMFIRSANFFTVYGGLVKFSPSNVGVSEGDTVEQGQQIGRVLGSYGMIHFELYRPDPDRTSNSRWWKGKSAPDGVYNPLNFVQVAAGQVPTRITPPQRHQALADLGTYAGAIVAPWTEDSKRALKDAQRELGIDDDGDWGPQTEEAITQRLGPPGVRAGVGREPDKGQEPANGQLPTPAPASWWNASRIAAVSLGVVGAAAFAGVFVARRRRRGV